MFSFSTVKIRPFRHPPPNFMRWQWFGREREFVVEVAMAGDGEKEVGCGMGWFWSRSGT